MVTLASPHPSGRGEAHVSLCISERSLFPPPPYGVHVYMDGLTKSRTELARIRGPLTLSVSHMCARTQVHTRAY